MIDINEVEPEITSDELAVVLQEQGSDQVVYIASTTIDDATFSLVDNTIYPQIASTTEPAETIISVPDQVANTQHVYISNSQISEDGSQVEVTYSYQSDDTTTTGVGFTVDFDNSLLSLNQVNNVFVGAIADGDLNDDGNSLAFGWASLFGAFPGSSPVDLATIVFDIDPSATDYAQLNVVETSSAAGFSFDGQSQQIAVVSGSGSSEGSSDSAESVVTVPDQLTDTQHVYVSESTKSEDGTQVTIKLSYMADNPSLTGVGFTLDFDSAALSLNNVSDILVGAIADGDLSQDGDSLAFGWASLFGGWPGSTTAELATITFDVAEGATGSTGLNIVQTSTAAGYSFDGQSHDVVISSESDSGATETMTSQLSIDSETGAVTLSGDANYDVVPSYNFTVTAENGAVSVSQDVGLLVADFLVSSAQDSYTGTEEADVFALFDGSALVTSGSGNDVFVLVPPSNEESEQPDDTVSEVFDTVISVPDQELNTQHVYISNSQISEDGSQVEVTYSYQSDDTTTTGVGFTVDFDNSLLSLNQVNNVFVGAIADGDLNDDGNSLAFGWASLFGAFPGSSPVDLATIVFDIDPSATDYAQLNVVETSSAAGFSFDGQSQQIALVEGSSGSSDLHTLVDFESGVDSIDMTAALASLGYTDENLNKLSDAEMPEDILDLISGNDSSLDNLFGGTYDDASNTLTLFADTNPEQGATEMEALQVKLGDDATIDEDDITVSFIA